MAGGLCMKKGFLIPLACGAVLGLLIVSGLSCVISDQNLTTGHAWPETESEFESKSYITPECWAVRECLQSILGDPPHEPTKDGFDAIRDWVAHNIEYKPDEERVGKEDDWQTSEEILDNPQVGDCEEFSILLCTLLRAYGIGGERVYVVIGVDGEAGAHAFLMEDWYLNGEWRALDPQAPAQPRHGAFRFPIGNSRLDRYEIIAGFNDLYYHDGSFPWDEDETDSSTLTNMATAVGDIARRLSQLLGYLCGLLFNGD